MIVSHMSEDLASKMRKMPEGWEGDKSKNPAQKFFSNLPYLQWNGVALIGDIVQHIFGFLSSSRDLLNVERVNKNYYRYTGIGWAKLNQKESLDLELACYQKEFCPAKWQYLVRKFLFGYIENGQDVVHMKSFDKDVAGVQEIYQRHEPLMLRFPILGTYLWTDLSEEVNLASRYREIFEKNNFNPGEAKGGDFLLQALYKGVILNKELLDDHVIDPIDEDTQLQSQRDIFKLLQAAIKNKATCTTYLALKALAPLELTSNFFFTLTVQEALQGEYRGMEKLFSLDPNFAAKKYEEGMSYPPLLACVATTFPLQTYERLIDEAIEGYGDLAPADILIDAASIKVQLNKWQEADSLYTRAIKAFDDNVPAMVLANAAVAKFKLNKWPDAKALIKQAITKFNGNVPPEIAAFALSVTNKLNADKKDITAP